MNNIQNLQAEMYKKIVDMFIDFGKKSLELQSASHTKYKYRDNLIYRIQSSVFHLQFIKYVKGQALEKLKENENDRNPILLIQIVREVYFSFEDLIYSLISQIDYLGNLIGYVYLGENKGNIKWNGISKYCRDYNTLFSNEKLRFKIIECDKLLFNHLYEYRSNLIHYKSDGSEAIHEEQCLENGIEHSLLIKAPERLCSIVKNLNISKDDDIIIVSNKICNEVFETVNNILTVISDDLVNRNKINMQNIIKESENKRITR